MSPATPVTRKSRAADVAESGAPSPPGPRPRRLPRSLKISEKIARDLVRDISERKLEAGTPLPHENEMVAQYGVGRASVREALRLLEAQGLIYLKPGRNGGPVLARTGPEQLGRMLTLYLGLSGATYGDLAEFMRTVSPRLAELGAMNPDRELVRSTLSNTNRNPCALVDASLGDDLQGPHELINRLAGNPVLTMFANAVDAVYASHLWGATHGEGFLEVAEQDHKSIAAAVMCGDGPLARRAMAEHLERAFAYAASKVPGIFEQTIEWR